MAEDEKARTEVRTGKLVEWGDYAVPPRITFRIEGGNAGDTPESAEPDFRVELGIRDGGPECRKVHIVAKPGGRAIEDSDLRRLSPLAELTARAFTRHAEKILEPGRAYVYTSAPEVVQGAAAMIGHRVRSMSLLRDVARIYLTNRTGAPTEAVRKIQHFSRSTAARRVADARVAGLLPDPRVRIDDATRDEYLAALDTAETPPASAPRSMPIAEIRTRLARRPQVDKEA